MSLVSSIFHTSSLFQFSLHTFTSEKNVVLPVYDDMDYMRDGSPDWVNLSETHFNQHSQTYPVDAEVTLAMVEFWSDEDTFCALFPSVISGSERMLIHSRATLSLGVTE